MQVSKALLSTLIKVADSYSLPRSYMITMAFIESAFNPRAYNKSSGASGLYQFLRSTAKAYKLADPFNPEQAAVAAAKFTNDNKKYISKHGVPSDEPYLYMAHQQGPGGIVAIWNAAKYGKALPSSIRRNMDANAGRGKTAQQFLNFWCAVYAEKAAKAAASNII